MSEWMERLEQYGVDLKTTMGRFLNDEGLYQRCFDMFLRDESLGNLGDALEKKDYEVAFAAAHTLKGVVGNMGFQPLYEAVCEIVEPLRSGITENLDSKYRKITEEFEKIRALR
jgi:HPt (histidine-containing phosphotransfer) domain-containing protein